MNMSELKSYISEWTGIPEDGITESSSLRDHLDLDSLKLLNLLIMLSKKFDIPLEHLIAARDLSTIGALYESIQMQRRSAL